MHISILAIVALLVYSTPVMAQREGLDDPFDQIESTIKTMLNLTAGSEDITRVVVVEAKHIDGHRSEFCSFLETEAMIALLGQNVSADIDTLENHIISFGAGEDVAEHYFVIAVSDHRYSLQISMRIVETKDGSVKMATVLEMPVTPLFRSMLESKPIAHR